MASAQGARVELGTGAAKLDVRAGKAAIITNSLGGRQLDPSQYNRNGLVDVWVSASVQQVFDIDTATQTFGLDAWINCLYFDPKVQREATEYRQGTYIAEDEQREKLTWDYYPVFHMMNNRDAEVVDFYALVYDEPAIGSVLISKRIIGHFFEPAKVHAFPFDGHRLDAKFFFNDCYKMHHSRDMPTGAFGHLVNNEWKISPHVHESLEKMTGASGAGYTRYSLAIDVERESASWVTNFIMPTSVLTLFGGFTMLMENDMNSRISSVVTLMLTQAALKLVLSANVPKVNYLTTMDQFVLASFGLLAAAGVEAALVGARPFRNDWDTEAVDIAVLAVYLTVWFLLHPYLFWAVRRDRRRATAADDRETLLAQSSNRRLSEAARAKSADSHL